MDELLKFYSNLNYTKCIEEQIVRDLRILHQPWIIKENIEIEKPKEDEIQREIDESIEQLKRIEELLNKAEKVYNKASSNEISKQKDENVKENNELKRSSSQQQIKTQPVQKSNEQAKTTTLKSSSQASKLPLAVNTKTNIPKPQKQPKPVYMNAPYKTEQINTFKNVRPRNTITSAKSVGNNINKPVAPAKVVSHSKQNENENKMARHDYDDECVCDDEDNEDAFNDNEIIKQPVKPLNVTSMKERSMSASANLPATKTTTTSAENNSDKLIIENEYKFSLKSNGKELHLPPGVDDLAIKNFKFKQTLYKLLKQRNEQQIPITKTQTKKPTAQQQFMEKLENSNLNKQSPSFIHYLIQKMRLIYLKMTNLTQKYSLEYEQVQNTINTGTGTDTDVFKLKLLKLHLFYETLVDYESKMDQQIEAIYDQINAYYRVIQSNSDSRRLFVSKNFNFDEDQNDFDHENNYYKRFLNYMPCLYKNESELKNYFNLKLNLIEYEYKCLYLNMLNKCYLEEKSLFEGDENGLKLYEEFNLLYNLVTNKRTVIVKE